MLQIKDIRKQYITGELVQTALNGVSLNLRDNEFVAILGPSGSGKTTLLNIIGGLDRYDSGNLIINSISTKKYTDRDWDSYRNHTIGFVFQSYNLIPHQTVLSNVELALTISGVSRAERRNRAIEALEKVGLGNQLHKRPNQMSGGQMQRVAIARALVNNPDILLADEPTGALDTQTSIQVMELLKEVAKERLVVMVTHNPELAKQYATRIVELRDGNIISDSNPYVVSENLVAEHKNMGKASMSFLTALALSFNNLRTKKGRTLLTAFAGSIGIIGIALILSLSNGVETYIQNVEEETLSEYPLSIQSSNMELLSFMQRPESEVEENESEVKERQVIDTLFSNISSNDLKSLKKYLDENSDAIDTYVNAVEYNYDVTPQIYRITKNNGYRQVNPDQTFSALMGGSGAGMFSSMMNTNVFVTLPEDEDLYRSQYEIKAGRWPQNYQECVVILSGDSSITDLALYALGLKDATELDKMLAKFSKNEEVEVVSEKGSYQYEDFLGIDFKLVDSADYYEYDDEYQIFVDKKDNQEYMQQVVENGENMTIVGVAMPSESATAAMISSGIAYDASLINHVMEKAADSKIVKEQLDSPDRNVFTGTQFDEPKENSFDLGSLFHIDTDGLKEKFSFDADSLKFDASAFKNLDLSSFTEELTNLDLSEVSDTDLSAGLQNLSLEVSQEELGKVFEEILNGYLEEAAKDTSTDYTKLGESFEKYLQSEAAALIIQKGMEDVLKSYSENLPDQGKITAMLQDIMSGFPDYVQKRIQEDLAKAGSLNNLNEIKNLSDLSKLTDVNNFTNIFGSEQLTGYLTDYLATESVQQKIYGYVRALQTESTQVAVDNGLVLKLAGELYNGYLEYAVDNQLPDPSKMTSSFTEYLSSEEGQKLVTSGLQRVVNLDSVQEQLSKMFATGMSGYSKALQKQMTKAMSGITEQITKIMMTQMTSIMEQLSGNLEDMFSMDADSLSDMIDINMAAEDLQELMASMMGENTTSYEGNLKKLNYAKEDSPSAISIYPKNFESKTAIINLLDSYNEQMDSEGNAEKVISYTDYVGTLMSSVTNIVDTISYVLVAFVAISLIVSSIMIGIITYISVLERTKEIGILRAIGASKGNISQVFNAETFIIGLLSGVLGIGIASLLLIPGNALIHAISGNYEVNAILPLWGAVILIIISVFLTLIGGFIPSKKAAKKDLVTSLRTE